MNRKKSNVVKDLNYRLYFLKNEHKYIVLKSIQACKEVAPEIRILAGMKLSRLKKKKSISRQKNPCLLTGRRKGVWKFNDISRHSITKFGNLGMLHNISIKSW